MQNQSTVENWTLSRREVVKAICTYIKKQGIKIDENNEIKINFQLPELISDHLITMDDDYGNVPAATISIIRY